MSPERESADLDADPFEQLLDVRPADQVVTDAGVCPPHGRRCVRSGTVVNPPRGAAGIPREFHLPRGTLHNVPKSRADKPSAIVVIQRVCAERHTPNGRKAMFSGHASWLRSPRRSRSLPPTPRARRTTASGLERCSPWVSDCDTNRSTMAPSGFACVAVFLASSAQTFRATLRLQEESLVHRAHRSRISPSSHHRRFARCHEPAHQPPAHQPPEPGRPKVTLPAAGHHTRHSDWTIAHKTLQVPHTSTRDGQPICVGSPPPREAGLPSQGVDTGLVVSGTSPTPPVNYEAYGQLPDRTSAGCRRCRRGGERSLVSRCGLCCLSAKRCREPAKALNVHAHHRVVQTFAELLGLVSHPSAVARSPCKRATHAAAHRAWARVGVGSGAAASNRSK